MTDDWLPSAVTGLVGLAGIASTLVASRASRRAMEATAQTAAEHANAARTREERRTAYSTFMAFVEEDRPWQMAVTPMPDPFSIIAMIKLIRSNARFLSALANLRLVASRDVAAQTDHVRAALRAKPAWRHRNRVAADDALQIALGELRMAMQQDLGYAD